tara:strand:- start:92 stop:403 length:312 start_codon:yes stop_codon:yes gene_type:complete
MLLFELDQPAFTQVSARVDMMSKNPDVPTREVGNKSPIESHAEDKDPPENIQDTSAAMKTDTRKTRLTLEQISKLRKLSDLKAAEYQSSIKEIRRQFAPAPAA